eukprot:scpid19548/ scgid5758/ Down syndrome cell adhesion molecule; CHD2
MQVGCRLLVLGITLLCASQLCASQGQFTLTLTSDFSTNNDSNRYAHTAEVVPYQVLENSSAPMHIANVFCSAQAPGPVFTSNGISLAFNTSLWTLNGVPIRNGTLGFRVVTDTVDGGAVLNGDWRISSRLFWPPVITPEMSGVYRCTLRNEVDIFRVHVQVRARIVAATPTSNITLGTVTLLRCDSVGDGPVTKIWTKNGQEVARGNTSQFPLTLQAVRSDSARYTCNVSNPFGQDSRTLTVTVQEVPYFPSAVINPSFIAMTTNSSNFTLPVRTINDGNSAVRSYTLTCTPTTSYAFAAQRNITVVEPQGVIDGLHPGVTYQCTFVATNGIGSSSPSDEVTLTTRDSFSGEPALSVMTNDSDSLRINYTAPAPDMRNGDINKYVLTYNRTNCYTPDGACPCTGYACSVQGSMSLDLSGMYVLAGLRRFTSYMVWLQAENDAGPGTPAISTARTAADVPGVPAVTTTTLSKTEIRVDWQHPREPNGIITGYVLAYREALETNESANEVRQFNANVTMFTLTGTEDTAYTISLAAINSIDTGMATVVNASTGASTALAAPAQIRLPAFQPGAIPCTIVRGNPLPNVTWTSSVFAGIRQGEANGSLLLDQARITDNGLYQCLGVNIYGNDMRSVTVDVTVTPAVVLTGPVAGTALSGEALYMLTCMVTGYPVNAVSVTWTSTQLALDDSSNTPASNLDGQVTTSDTADGVNIVTRTVMVTGNQQYTCRTSRPDVVQRSVNVPWTVPTVQAFNPSVASIGEGENATLLCTCSGSPYPLMTLYQGQSEIMNTRRARIGSTVEISVTVFSGGDFRCIATNRAGSSNMTTSVRGPAESESLIPGLKNLYLWIIIGGVAALILIIIIICVARRRRTGGHSKTYRVREDLRSYRDGNGYNSSYPGQTQLRTTNLEQGVVYPNENAVGGANNGGVSNGFAESGFDDPRYSQDWAQQSSARQANQPHASPSTFQPGATGSGGAHSTTTSLGQHQHQQANGGGGGGGPGQSDLVYYDDSNQPDGGMGMAGAYDDTVNPTGGKAYYDDSNVGYGAEVHSNGINEYHPGQSPSRADLAPPQGFESDGQQPNQEALPTFTARHGDHILTAL